jgi:hypothetical protein
VAEIIGWGSNGEVVGKGRALEGFEEAIARPYNLSCAVAIALEVAAIGVVNIGVLHIPNKIFMAICP